MTNDLPLPHRRWNQLLVGVVRICSVQDEVYCFNVFFWFVCVCVSHMFFQCTFVYVSTFIWLINKHVWLWPQDCYSMPLMVADCSSANPGYSWVAHQDSSGWDLLETHGGFVVTWKPLIWWLPTIDEHRGSMTKASQYSWFPLMMPFPEANAGDHHISRSYTVSYMVYIPTPRLIMKTCSSFGCNNASSMEPPGWRSSLHINSCLVSKLLKSDNKQAMFVLLYFSYG